MAKKPYKKLSPEAQALKNQKQREKTRRLREAGFTRDQARSLEKTLKDAPAIVQAPTEAVLEVIGSINKFADWLMDDKKTSKKKIAPPRPKKPKKKKKRITHVNYPENVEDFEEFVRANPGLAGYRIIDAWNDNFDERISRKKGYEEIKKVRKPRPPADGSFIVDNSPIRYYSVDERKPFGGSKKLLKDRYMYLMAYDVEQDNGTTRQDFMYIASPTELTRQYLHDKTVDVWANGVNKDVNERYRGVMIIEESIFLVYAVDTTL